MKSRRDTSGEAKVRKWLATNNIKFIKEYSANGLRNPLTGFLLFIDFYLPDHKVAIEVDGEQHYSPEVFGNKRFIQQQILDGFKNEYCIDNEIKLIRITYDELKDESLKDLIIPHLKVNPSLLTYNLKDMIAYGQYLLDINSVTSDASLVREFITEP